MVYSFKNHSLQVEGDWGKAAGWAFFHSNNLPKTIQILNSSHGNLN